MNKIKETKIQYIIVFLIALSVYWLTCAGGLLWQDSGMIQYRTIENDIKGGLGLALAHPLFYFFTITAKYIPIGDLIFRINLVSVFASALAIANLYLLLKLMFNRTFFSILSVLTLGLSHTFWWHSSVLESYNMYAAILFAELVFLLLYIRNNKKKYFYALFFLNGLSVAVHLLGIIPLACYGIFALVLLVRRNLKINQLFFAIILWIIAASPYLYLVLAELISTGDLGGTISSALFGNSWKSDVLNIGFSKKVFIQNFLFLGMNFPTPNILLAVLGVISVYKFKEKFFVFLSGLLVLFLLFAARYTVADRYAFFIPFYCMLTIFFALGAIHLEKLGLCSKSTKVAILLMALLTIPAYYVSPTAVERAQFNIGTRADIPYRNDYQWFLSPWKTGYYGADIFAAKALAELPQGAAIYADGTTVYPLIIYQKLNNFRNDISILATHGSLKTLEEYPENLIYEKINQNLFYTTQQSNPIIKKLGKDYEMVKKDLLWQIVKKDDL